MNNNILVFKKFIILREKGFRFKILFAKYYKPVHETSFFEKRFRACGALGKLTNFSGGEL
ncbi:hypothetical protein TREPR_1706 [Treponema primitia ZAS-2]|uniref:Uncharacterized protein n=1 Tax=Treponema primitia (strain ATCC BAA-887 / DSM 12427 / ZAS-2) TaxID=545694 RepID=F5YMW1_TREPZ|nr:hypothetical protein TREPR_1706 [Treponema primitia ZAS-2]